MRDVDPGPGMDNERLARYLTGESDQAERRAVEEWLAADSSRQAELARLSAALDSVRGGERWSWDAEAAWARFQRGRQASPVRAVYRRAPTWWAAAGLAAAGLLVAVVLGVGGASTLRASPDHALADTLPDGTAVVLSPGSVVVLKRGFGPRHRVVDLEGEAWFRVAPGRLLQFMVRTRQLRVVDLGTVFVVRAPVDDQSAWVSVSEGSVSVTRAGTGGDTAVIVRAAETLTAGQGLPMEVVQDSVLSLRWGWDGDRLDITAMPLQALARRIGQWFGVAVRLEDSSLAGLRLTASLVNPDLNAVLDVVQAGLGLEVVRRGDTVAISPAR